MRRTLALLSSRNSGGAGSPRRRFLPCLSTTTARLPGARTRTRRSTTRSCSKRSRS